MKTMSRIDLKAIAARANLEWMISSRQGQPSRGKFLCAFHDDHSPSMTVTPDGKRFRCWSCQASGDALDWLVMTGQASSVMDAAGQIDPSVREGISWRVTPEPRTQTVEPAPTPKPKPSVRQSANWQDAVDQLVTEAERNLWSPVGARALEWLKWRGLAEWAIGKYRLGFMPDQWRSTSQPVVGKDGQPAALWCPRGVSFPWVGPGSWYGDQFADEQPEHRWIGCNVRRLSPDPFDRWVGSDKCMAVSGSSRGYGYPFPDELVDGVPALVLEGEIDCLLAHQIVGHMVQVVGVGGASQRPRPETLEELRKKCPVWILGFDADPAGMKAAAMWEQLGFSRCRRLILPAEGADIGEMVQSGLDLRSWLRSECNRLGVRL